MEPAVIDLLQKSAAIPSMPQAAARFLELVQNPELDYGEVVDVLSADPGTASEILRLANSSLFGVARHVSSLHHALTLLGLRRVRSLVLGRYIVESIDSKKLTRIDMPYFWQRSLTCAVLSCRLARIVEPLAQEEAFTSGLLADIGVIVLDEVLAREYADLAAQYRPHGDPALAAREVSQIGISHACASAIVLEHWQLPEIVCEAVRRHPWDLETAQPPPLARIVGAADLLGKYLCDERTEIDTALDICRRIGATLRIDPETMSQVLAGIETQIDEFTRLLRVKVVPSALYRQIAHGLSDRLADPQWMER